MLLKIVVYFGKIYFEQIKLGKTLSDVFILTKIISTKKSVELDQV